jgi:CheY-like chemotaxis protein
VSAVGRGTTFLVYLPRLASAAVAKVEDAPATEAPRGGETVLLVEDDRSVRELVRVFLERLGYTVLEAASGTEAVDLVAQHDGPTDLLLTDVVMPGLGGRETTKALFSLRPDMKVLYMSGYTDDVVVRQGVVDENLNFIAKPFDLKTLARKLRTILDAG